jgi:hypothetical protein
MWEKAVSHGFASMMLFQDRFMHTIKINHLEDREFTFGQKKIAWCFYLDSSQFNCRFDETPQFFEDIDFYIQLSHLGIQTPTYCRLSAAMKPMKSVATNSSDYSAHFYNLCKKIQDKWGADEIEIRPQPRFPLSPYRIIIKERKVLKFGQS